MDQKDAKLSTINELSFLQKHFIEELSLKLMKSFFKWKYWNPQPTPTYLDSRESSLQDSDDLWDLFIDSFLTKEDDAKGITAELISYIDKFLDSTAADEMLHIWKSDFFWYAPSEDRISDFFDNWLLPSGILASNAGAYFINGYFYLWTNTILSGFSAIIAIPSLFFVGRPICEYVIDSRLKTWFRDEYPNIRKHIKIQVSEYTHDSFNVYKLKAEAKGFR